MDVIHLLPDEVANQIAAGEVVQRPASVIKELVENSIDAGATSIKVIIKEAGRNLIQVIDDGKGMSPTDARMAFERHATSKIRQATDLFSLHTMGFRGEALASIAAVAQVELVTKQRDEEMGSKIVINGGKVESQEPVSCPAGSNFSIKNLFYNIPARRKFLKSNATEFGQIQKSFDNIVLVYPELSFELSHNDQRSCFLPASSLKERICNLFGKSLNSMLFNVEVDSPLVNIKGFVGKPETARKQNDKQFFFVNGRYMKHPYFHKAVMQAYEGLVQNGMSPTYFLYLDVDPASIDVNIHPTKTEIKFENEQSIWPILRSAVREVLGRFDVTDSIDFDQTDSIEMPSYLDLNKDVKAPQIHVNPDYNPFKTAQSKPLGMSGGQYSPHAESNARNWEQLYNDFNDKRSAPFVPDFDEADTIVGHGGADSDLCFQSEPVAVQSSIDFGSGVAAMGNSFLQYKNKYILTSVKSGLMCIDQHRAHYRVLFEHYKTCLENHKCASQRLLLPEVISLMPADSLILDEIMDDLQQLGYDIERIDDSKYQVNAVPAENMGVEALSFVTEMVDSVRNEDLNAKALILEKVATAQARMAAIPYGRKLSDAEMADLVNNLFLCSSHGLTPDNKQIICIITDDDLERRLR